MIRIIGYDQEGRRIIVDEGPCPHVSRSTAYAGELVTGDPDQDPVTRAKLTRRLWKQRQKEMRRVQANLDRQAPPPDLRPG